jgi:hypothetical protein
MGFRIQPILILLRFDRGLEHKECSSEKDRSLSMPSSCCPAQNFGSVARTSREPSCLSGSLLGLVYILMLECSKTGMKALLG